ncbi:MAG: cellulase family glycosylhydrolase [Streptosporangiaceae bacterium]
MPAFTRLARATALALTAVLAVGAAAVPARADTARYVTDDRGRALILHGLNTAGSAKGPTGLPWITRDDVVRERTYLGSNAVRYLIQWKNVEPQPGTYDEAYLDQVAQRLTWYREQGVNVILDMHQDIFGPAACSGAGNGAPAWATITDGLGCTPQSPWVLTYLQPAVLRAYDNFWNNNGRHPELRQRYAAMWQHVADRFKDDPAVLGYDLMNEPFGGTRQFGFFEGPVLTPFYQRIVDRIRSVDRDNWIFLEPQSLGPNQGLDSSLGKVRGSRLVLAPHFYPGAVDLGGTYSGLTKALVQVEFLAWRSNMGRLAARHGWPLWIGEVGSMAMDVPGAPEFTRDWLKLTEDLRIGWSYWSNDLSGDPTGANKGVGPLDASGLTEVGEILARPFPRAVAGTPTALSYAGDALTVSWTRNGATGPTEIWFPGTTTPRVTTGDRYTWDAATRTLLVFPADTATHTVTVAP